MITTRAILTRHGLNRPAWLDRPTGQVIRRYERDRPGELVHVDVYSVASPGQPVEDRVRDGPH